jgi:trans-aconitate methyltransferase
MKRHEHWDRVFATKGDDEVSWFESMPAVSLEMMEAAGLDRDSCVIDVGGGKSRLVDVLTARGLDSLAILDVSSSALLAARQRLGPAAPVPTWIEADVTSDWSVKPMDIWHDRAVFHFLTSPHDRARYRERLLSVLKPRLTH